MRKRLFAALIAGALAVCLSASSAWGAAAWIVQASGSDGSAISELTPGSQLILDITLRTTDGALGLAGSVNGYDPSVLSLNASQSLIPTSVLDQVCFPGAGCFGGLQNQVGTSIPLQERAVGPGVEVEFFAGVALSPAGGDGSIDPGAATGIPGDPQFRIVFDVIGFFPTTLQIGTFAEYLDAYIGTEDSLVENASIEFFVIPEPGTALLLGMGLVGLASLAPPRAGTAP